MVGRFTPMRKQLSFDVVEAQRAEAMRMGRINARAAQATPQREVQPQVQREVRQAAPLQLAPQSRFVDPSEIATAITGRGPQGLDTSYTVNLQPDSQRLMSNRVIPEYRVADKQQYLEGVGNAEKASMYGGMGNFEPQTARPQQSEGSPYYEGQRSRPNYRSALEATKTQYNDLLADGTIAPFTPAPLNETLYQGLLANGVIKPFNRTALTNEADYLKGTAMETADKMVGYNLPPSLPRGATGELKGIPAVDMEYGRIETLPNGMKQQGSFYTPVQLGTGTTELYSIDDMLKLNEEAIDSFGGGSNSRFMRGNDYNGYEVVDPADKKGWGESIPFDKSDTWVNSGAYAPARFTKSEREYTPLISINSQGKPAPVPQSDELSSSVVPAWQNGNISPEYSSVIPQRLVDSIDKNVKATSPSQNVTEQMINSGSVDPNIARTVAQVKAPVYSTAEIPSAYQRPDQAPTQGSYSMQTFEDPAVFGAYEKNFAQAGNELMLPSTAIRDRTVVPSHRQGPGGRLAPIESEPVLSPYPLALGGTYAKSDLTAKSSMKADLGSDERLAYMLRSERQPDLPEFGDRSPDYVKFVPQTQTIGNQFQETMTDAHDVRRRIAAQANNMGNAARIAEQGAARTTYPRNAYDVQVDPTMHPVPGAFENPAVMTANDMRAARMRQDATEMQHRLTFTDDAIAEAYNRLDAKAGTGMDTQRVLVSQTGPDGIIRNQAHNISLEEQLQMGAELQRQGYARDVNLVPQGYSVTYGEEYPAWEGKNHQLNVNPRIFGSSVPIVAVPEDLTGWGRAVQLR